MQLPAGTGTPGSKATIETPIGQSLLRPLGGRGIGGDPVGAIHVGELASGPSPECGNASPLIRATIASPRAARPVGQGHTRHTRMGSSTVSLTGWTANRDDEHPRTGDANID